MAVFKENDDNYKKLQHIRESAISASQLTAQLLAFSRRQILKPEVINLNDTIRKMKSILRRVIKESVKLEFILDENLNNIKTDPLQMEQIIMNLATNANDAMENGGTLTIETKNVFLDEEYTEKHMGTKTGAYVQMKIIDTGVGIDDKVLENIFEPFYTTKEMGRGTGLGLATVYGIIKQSGGNIWVDSRPGKGSSFNIYLPQTDEKLTIHNAREGKKEQISGSETILVVEDQQDILDLISMSLSDSGYNVLVASDGNEAMKVVVNYKKAIHLLLTDVIMPNINGQELAENLSVVYPDLKVIYMSGYADNAIARLGVLDVDQNFIQKPFTPFELVKKIQEILNKK
jgi:CheY-like chemotaxis protein